MFAELMFCWNSRFGLNLCYAEFTFCWNLCFAGLERSEGSAQHAVWRHGGGKYMPSAFCLLLCLSFSGRKAIKLLVFSPTFLINLASAAER